MQLTSLYHLQMPTNHNLRRNKLWEDTDLRRCYGQLLVASPRTRAKAHALSIPRLYKLGRKQEDCCREMRIVVTLFVILVLLVPLSCHGFVVLRPILGRQPVSYCGQRSILKQVSDMFV